MRVVHVINNLPTGGAERFLLELTAAQARAGLVPSVLALARPTPLAAAFTARGVPVQALDRARLSDPRLLFDVWRALLRLAPDVVHTHLFYADFFGRAAARLAGVRGIVGTEHSTERDPLSRRRLSAMRLAARWAHRLVAVSPEVRDAAAARLRLPAERIAVIANGIDVAAFGRAAPLARAALGAGPDTLLVGCVGRLVESKRWDAVLDAIARPESPPVAVVFAGDGPMRPRLEAQARALGQEARVRFLGVIDDVAPLLRALDVFVLPSRFEGHSIALLEALAAGRACIVADIPELTAVAGDAALAVAPGDASAIATALHALAAPTRRAALGRAAAARAAAFDIATVAAQYAQVYDDVLRNAPRR